LRIFVYHKVIGLLKIIQVSYSIRDEDIRLLAVYKSHSAITQAYSYFKDLPTWLQQSLHLNCLLLCFVDLPVHLIHTRDVWCKQQSTNEELSTNWIYVIMRSSTNKASQRDNSKYFAGFIAIRGSRVILTITRGDTESRQLDSSLIVTKCKDV
jgi:hypothetical protein